VIIKNIQQNTDEWLAWRKGKIGASDAAAILGKCKYNTAYGLWLVKTGRAEGFQGNAASERGHEMEAKARASYEILNGFVEMPSACVQHDSHENISASLDGLSEDGKTILEIKYPSQASHEMALRGEVPEHYYIQCQHQLMCVPNATECHYWSYREGNGALIRVKPDYAFQAILLAAELAFLDLMKSDIAPPLTERDAKVVDAPEVKALCSELIELKAEKSKIAKVKSDRLKAQVIELGGHNKVRCGGVLVSFNQATRSYRMTVSQREDFGGDAA
jgi:putative phage-type endonuclease